MPNHKRVVFIDANGFAHIMGVLDYEEHDIKLSAEFHHKGKKVSAGLVKVSTRMVLYREFEKRDNVFHPAQR